MRGNDRQSRQPAISIVTPVRNRRHLLGRAIRSVLGQTLGDWEWLIVDDASDDCPEELVRSWSDRRIRYERLERQRGANAARNHGIALTRSPIVTFLDSDDEFLPRRLEKTLSILNADEATDLLISSFETRKACRSSRSINRSCVLAPDALERALVSHAVFLGGSAITMRRELLDRCGGFAECLQRMQDREMLLSVAAAQAKSSRQGARLLSSIDWIKYQQTDSISSSPEGFVTALGAMFALHPDVALRHGALVRYHVARRMLSCLMRGDVHMLRLTGCENVSVEGFGFGARDLVTGYVRGRMDRVAVVRELRSRGACVTDR
ncbi:MAG: glycosyltransferase family 2 protein [Planctomycetaceae bacterium]